MPSWVRWGTRFLALIPCLQCTTAVAVTYAYVLGSNDARIARVNLDTGTVTPSVATTGAFPNRIDAGFTGKLAAVANSGSDDVTLVQLRTGTVVGTVALPAGSDPWAVEVAGRRVFVTALLDDRVYEIDPVTGSIVRSAPTGKAPEGMTVSAGKLWVANSGFDFGTFTYDPGSVTVLDLETLATVATVPVDLNPQDCLRAPDGKVHVVCTGDFFQVTGAVDVLDPEHDAVVGTIPVDGRYPGGGAITPGGIAYLNVTTPSFGSEVWSYDAGSFALLHDGADPLLPSPDFFGALAVTEDGRLVVPDFSADLLLVEDPSSPGSPHAYLVGDGPISTAIVDGPVAQPVPEGAGGLSVVDNAAPERGVRFAAVAPNPSRGPVDLAVRAPAGAEVSLTILDVRGRRVRELGTAAASGRAAFTWDGADARGAPAGPGVYFARAESAAGVAVTRVLRIR